jgi:hypothetical protein
MATIKPSDSSATLRAADFFDTDETVTPELTSDENEVATETTPLLGDVESQMPPTINNTKYYAMVGSFATFVLGGTVFSYALINGYITWLPW